MDGRQNQALPEIAAWRSQFPQLRPDVQRLTGAGGVPQLFLPERGTYVRLSAPADRIVTDLDGTRTGEDLVRRFGTLVRSREPQSAVFELLEQLREAGALTRAPDAPRGRGRLAHWLLSRPRRRWTLVRSVDKIVAGPGHLAARLTCRLGGVIIAIAVLASAALSMAAIGRPISDVHLPMFLVAAAVLLPMEAVAHETAHAIMCAAFGVRVRGAGIALWYGVVPTVFIDHTDSHRLQSRGKLAAITLAGPVVDVVAAGLLAGVALLAAALRLPTLMVTCQALIVVQLAVLANNLNPLLPSDGHNTVELALRVTNLRRRALGTVTAAALGTSGPPALRNATPSQRMTYFCYGLALIAYPLALAALSLRALLALL